MTFLSLIIYVLILGFIAWLVSIAPMINPTFKAFINFLLIAAAGILVIVFLIGIAHGGASHAFDLRL